MLATRPQNSRTSPPEPFWWAFSMLVVYTFPALKRRLRAKEKAGGLSPGFRLKLFDHGPDAHQVPGGAVQFIHVHRDFSFRLFWRPAEHLPDSCRLGGGSHGIWLGTLGRFRPGRLGYRFSRPRYSVGFRRASVICGGFPRGPLADLLACIVSPFRAVLSAALLFPPDILNYSKSCAR